MSVVGLMSEKNIILLIDLKKVNQKVDRSEQTVHCLPFYLHFLNALVYNTVPLLKFEGDYSNFVGCPNFQEFYGSYVKKGTIPS